MVPGKGVKEFMLLGSSSAPPQLRENNRRRADEASDGIDSLSMAACAQLVD
jgi:hypothetical protein